MRHICLLALLFIAVQASPATTPAKHPCKTPQIAPNCYWAHGRLSVYNGGYPNFRLWRIGTNRMMGIWNSPWDYAHRDQMVLEDEDDNFPANIETLKINFLQVNLFGDFEVCPLEPLKPAARQAACIAAAKHLVTKPY